MKKSEICREASRLLTHNLGLPPKFTIDGETWFDQITWETTAVLSAETRYSNNYLDVFEDIKAEVHPFKHALEWVQAQGYDTESATFEETQDYRIRYLEHLAQRYEKEGN